MAFLSIQVATHLIQPLPPQKNANRTLPTLVMKSTIEAITIDYIRLQVENYLVFASISKFANRNKNNVGKYFPLVPLHCTHTLY